MDITVIMIRLYRPYYDYDGVCGEVLLHFSFHVENGLSIDSFFVFHISYLGLNDTYC